MSENLEYMAKQFGFFVPFLENVIDLEGLVEYLGQKVAIGNVCLWCGKSFHSLEAVRVCPPLLLPPHLPLPFLSHPFFLAFGLLLAHVCVSRLSPSPRALVLCGCLSRLPVAVAREVAVRAWSSGCSGIRGRRWKEPEVCREGRAEAAGKECRKGKAAMGVWG